MSDYSDPDGNEQVEEEPEPYYATVAEFVDGLLAPIWRRRIDPDGRTTTWCREWWLHPEAIARLDAIWRAWENLRLDPASGISVWFRDHADYHMPIITSADGPLGGCTVTQHKPKFNPLPTLPPDPPNLFSIDY